MPLPPFAWAPASEHAALQEAAEAVGNAELGAAAARLAWRGWAARPANAARVLDLAWWAVAAVFQPEHPAAGAIQECVVASLARHYVSMLLARCGDSYLRLWAAVSVAAAVGLLAAAFPADASELRGAAGARLEARLRQQLRLWTTGEWPPKAARTRATGARLVQLFACAYRRRISRH